MNIENVLSERSVYGSYSDKAEFIQLVKMLLRGTPSWDNQTASQKESLDMIISKIGRIVYGDTTYRDNWIDIVGYATLVIQEMSDESN